MRRQMLFMTVLMGLVVLLGAAPTTTAGSHGAIEVASGYKLVKVANKIVPMPTSIAFGHYGNLYVSSMMGQIAVLPCRGRPWNLVPLFGLSAPMGLAVHPHTGYVYVTHRYYVDNDPTNGDPDNVKSRISKIHPYSGQITTFVEGLPSMFFGEMAEMGGAVSGCQGIDFDSAGNLYVAQGINDTSRADGDPHQSCILKIDPSGDVSVFASGLRSPYDVRVGRETYCGPNYGSALYLYSGDNGEGANNEDHGSKLDSRQYYDELNRVVKGKHYGWPEGGPGHPEVSHIGPLWNFDVSPISGSWSVPTGIDSMPGKHGDIVFLGMFNCPSMFLPDLGTVEMFSGINCTDRRTLAKYIDGTIDVRLGPWGHRLYFAEFQSGDIYYIAPHRSWTHKAN